MRKRDALFADTMMREMDMGAHEVDAQRLAVRRAYGHRHGYIGDVAADHKAEAVLAKPEVRERMAAYLEAQTGMTPGEMLSIRVQFARGEKTESRVVKGGKDEGDRVAELPIAASLQLKALEGLEKLVFTPATQRVEIDQRSTLSAVVMNDLGSHVPMMDARTIEALPTLEPVFEGDVGGGPGDGDDDDDEDDDA